MDFGEQKARILDGVARVPVSRPLEVLAEKPGLVAWVGRKAEGKDAVLDAFPIFTAREAGETLTTTKAGIVLLTDLARDAATENRFSTASFTLGNYDQLDEHIRVTFGALTHQYLLHEYCSRRLGPDTGRFLARRMGRILRANYNVAYADLVADKTRLVLTKPHTMLTKFDSNERFTTITGFARWLGERWMEAEHRLLTKRPKLEDRSDMFELLADDYESDQTPKAEAA